MFFADAKGYLMMGLEYAIDNAREASFNLHSVRLNPSAKIPLDWALTGLGAPKAVQMLPADYSFQHKDFTDVTPDIGEERLDRIHTYQAQYSATVIGELSAKFSYQHIATESNDDSLDSAENIYALSFLYKF